MAKRKAEFPSEDYEESWDKKKIAIALTILVFLLAGAFLFKKYLLPKAENLAGLQAVTSSQVQGVSTQNPLPQKISLPSKEDIQNQIQTLKTEAQNLNLEQIASSSPQVQQIIQQLQSLPQQPVNQAKDACIRLCNNL